MRTTHIIGLTLGFFTTIVNSFGKISWKFWKESPNKCKRQAPYLILASMSILNLLVYALLPFSIACIFSAMPIVLSHIASKYLLGTKLTYSQWTLSVFIFVSLILIIWSGSDSEDDKVLHTFEARMQKPIPITFGFIPPFTIIFGLMALKTFSDEKLGKTIIAAVLGSFIGTNFSIIVKVSIKIIYAFLVASGASKGYIALIILLPIMVLLQLRYVGFMWRNLNLVYVLSIFQSSNTVAIAISGIIFFGEVPADPHVFYFAVIVLALLNTMFVWAGNHDDLSIDSSSEGSENLLDDLEDIEEGEKKVNISQDFDKLEMIKRPEPLCIK